MILFVCCVLIAGVLGLEQVAEFTLPDDANPVYMDLNNVYVPNGTLTYTAYNFTGAQQANFTPGDGYFRFTPFQYLWYFNDSADLLVYSIEKNGSISSGDPKLVIPSSSNYIWEHLPGKVSVSLGYNVSLYYSNGEMYWETPCRFPYDANPGFAYGNTNLLLYYCPEGSAVVNLTTCVNGKVEDVTGGITLDMVPPNGLSLLLPISDTDGWGFYYANGGFYIFEYSSFKKKGDEISFATKENENYYIFVDKGEILVMNSSLAAQTISYNRLDSSGTLIPIWSKTWVTRYNTNVLRYDNRLLVGIDNTYYVIKLEDAPSPTPIPTPIPTPTPTPTPAPEDSGSSTAIVVGGVIVGLTAAGVAVFYFMKK